MIWAGSHYSLFRFMLPKNIQNRRSLTLKPAKAEKLECVENTPTICDKTVAEENLANLAKQTSFTNILPSQIPDPLN